MLRYIVALAVFMTPAYAEIYSITPSQDAYDQLQEALIMAEPGDEIFIAAGQYDFVDGLSLDVDGVTIRGEGHDKTILDFSGQMGAGEGLLITGSQIVLQDFAVQNSAGDGIKAKGSDQITFQRIRVEWTNGPDENNGAYALYPVECRNVLIEDSIARGASDAGIYVGQSQNIIVRRSLAEYNVAGIEIENSYFADVYENTATHNTGGILVFDLPNLEQMGGHSVRVYDNDVFSNDTPNFAPAGNIVGTVPRGTGILIMANKNVHIFNNRLDDHAMTHIAIVSYFEEYEDENYNPYARGIVIRDNIYGKSGFDPSGDVGLFFADAAQGQLGDIIWDGVTPIFDWLTWSSDEDRIYVNEKDATFTNLRMMAQTVYPWGASVDTNVESYAGTLPEPRPVQLAQGQ